ncbi:hypothetical protein CPter291_3682 [Collimonas pratensis]|uniref:Uncharacterized protein n=1 Tax=Collimonas pratensis TaxID=279113 RepID=A0ABN4MD20_9BURK|nr:hypothetical protein CPter291_3682 [Collimonas pratensis]
MQVFERQARIIRKQFNRKFKVPREAFDSIEFVYQKLSLRPIVMGKREAQDTAVLSPLYQG